jgi:hypothetical protein
VVKIAQQLAVHAAVLGRRMGVCCGSGRGPNSDLVHQTLEEGGIPGIPCKLLSLTSGGIIANKHAWKSLQIVSPVRFAQIFHHVQRGACR